MARAIFVPSAPPVSRSALRHAARRSGAGRLRPVQRRVRRPARVKRIVWLFSMVLGYSRLIWGRFVVHQDLQSVLRCHIAALEAIDGVPREILYDRMKTAVISEDADGLVVYNPRACRSRPRELPLPAARLPALSGPRPKTRSNGRSATSARTSSSAGTFHNLDDLNDQLRHWLDTIANPRVHATTRRIINEAFARGRSPR